MTQSEFITLLVDSLSKLDEGEKWLHRSYGQCSVITDLENLTDEEFDAFETLTSRFARVSDMLLRKAFRSLDRLELEEGGTLIDVLNRAEKRGVIESADSFREIREFRNEIAHEYTVDGLSQLFSGVLRYTPELFKISENLRTYCERYTSQR